MNLIDPFSATRRYKRHQNKVRVNGLARYSSHLESKLSGFRPPPPQFVTARADISLVTKTPHHGVTHGSNI